jgi:hypothetical protein
MPLSSIEWVKEAAVTGWVWLFGWSAYYLYLVSKWQAFLMSRFFINLFLAFFIGYVVWQFLDDQNSYRDWILAISWFASFPILDLFEKKGSHFINKFLK